MARAPIHASRDALTKAWALGQRMAARDRRFRPNLKDARQYHDFEAFRKSHRAVLEMLESFADWDSQISDLAMREGRRQGFRIDRNLDGWDSYMMRILDPIKNAFWTGWEQAYKLEQRFTETKKQEEARLAAKPEVEVFPAMAVSLHAEIAKATRSAGTGDEDFWLHVTEDPSKPGKAPSAAPAGDKAATPGAEIAGDDRPGVFPASLYVSKRPKPQPEQAGDEDFWLRVTETGPSPAQPQVPPVELAGDPQSETSPTNEPSPGETDRTAALHEAAGSDETNDFDLLLDGEVPDIDSAQSILPDGTAKKPER